MKPDLVVAGGGPTGLGAAIAAARAGMKVRVHEPREGVLDKACGEGLMPGGLADLAELGVPDVAGVPLRGIRWFDAAEPAHTAAARFREPARGVRRTTLHAALRETALAAGVRFEASPFAVTDPRGGPWVVAADGLHSGIRRALGVALPALRPPRFGMRRHFHVAPWSDHVEVHFGAGAEAYVTPVAPDLVEVAFLFEGKARWEELLPRFPAVSARVRGAAAASELRGGGPFEQRVARRVIGRVLLAGDAAGYVDPITGEGVALGLATARAAVEAIARGTPLSYERRYRELTLWHVVITTAMLGIARHRALHAPMLQAASLVPALVDGVLGRVAFADPEARLRVMPHRDKASLS